MLTNHRQIGRLISGGEGWRLGGDLAFILTGALQDDVLQFYPFLLVVRLCLRTERIRQVRICFANGGLLYRDVMLSCSDGSRLGPHSEVRALLTRLCTCTSCAPDITSRQSTLDCIGRGNGISEDNKEFNFSSREWLQ